jgi:WD40 repeat protein
VCSIGFDSDAQHLFAGTEGGSVYAWNLQSQKANILKGHKTAITSIAYEKQSNIIATASVDSNVKIWDLRASNSQAIFTY